MNLSDILHSRQFLLIIDLTIYLIPFIIALRAVFFFVIRKDPINAINPLPKKFWFTKLKERDDIRQEIMDKG